MDTYTAFKRSNAIYECGEAKLHSIISIVESNNILLYLQLKISVIKLLLTLIKVIKNIILKINYIDLI